MIKRFFFDRVNVRRNYSSIAVQLHAAVFSRTSRQATATLTRLQTAMVRAQETDQSIFGPLIKSRFVHFANIPVTSR
ncbi:MAG: hypothetical protein ACD_39C01641G0001 [uncultured bacterium]|nr:MAG: hypothetical protein ACD_39C01641G0001 [uncultured bacterium]